jgi:peptidoglycan/xylan/chitin deacetylase (PgdA/CDA1 family)
VKLVNGLAALQHSTILGLPVKDVSSSIDYIRKTARRTFLLFVAILSFTGAGLLTNIWQLQHTAYVTSVGEGSLRSSLRADLRSQIRRLHQLESSADALGDHLSNAGDLEASISRIQLSLAGGDLHLARTDIDSLRGQVDGWQTTIEQSRKQHAEAARADAEAKRLEAEALVPVVLAAGSYNIPILIYHHTPTNFAAQLDHLTSHGYTTISLDELVGGLHGGPLPAKPVVLTYDDGFTDQLVATRLLQSRHMKATFYIIVGGQGSGLCIGANRSNYSCGDAYLSWDQIRGIDSDPLFTIAAHTVDHLALAGQSLASQEFQIKSSKSLIEAQIGHTINHFAYPYGSYNAATIRIVQEAGFTTAVSTLPGTTQSLGNLYALRRIRSTLQLP